MICSAFRIGNCLVAKSVAWVVSSFNCCKTANAGHTQALGCVTVTKVVGGTTTGAVLKNKTLDLGIKERYRPFGRNDGWQGG